MTRIITVPAPSTVTVTSNKTIQFTGCSVIMTYTVELNPAVDVPVTVNTTWTVSSEVIVIFIRLDHTVNNLTKYISTDEVRGLGGSCVSGNFTCTATVSSPLSFGSQSSQCTCEIVDKVGKNFNLCIIR